MDLWLVSIPIEGHPLPEKESDYLQYGEIVFHQYNDPSPEYGKRFVASTIVQGGVNIVTDKARATIQDAITILSFTSGLPLKLNDSDYLLTPKKDSNISGIPFVGGKGFRRIVASSLSLWYRIGDDDTRSIFSRIEHLRSEKKDLFTRALKHYRVALGSPNPFQEIVSYFSAVSVITSDIRTKAKPDRSDLRNVLRDVADLTSRESRKDFNKALDKYYEIDRTVGAHGTLDIDILDPARIKECNTDAKNLKRWVRKLLVSYLDRNQTPTI